MAADIPNNFVEFTVTSFDEFQVQNEKSLANISQKANLNFSESIAICLHNVPFHLELYSFIRIALMVVFFAYCLVCAWCFTWIELGNWHTEYRAFRSSLDRQRNEMSQLICDKLMIEDCDYDVFNEAYKDYEKFLVKHYHFVRFEENTIPWTFRNSLGFVLAIFFTTGDTPLAPRTEIGRILSCLLPILGIPLFLTVSLFYGKLLNQLFSWAYMKIITKGNVDDSTENSNRMILTVLHPKTLELSCKTKTFHCDSETERAEQSSSYMLSTVQNNELIISKKIVSQVKRDQPSESTKVNKESDGSKKSDAIVDLPHDRQKRRPSLDRCTLPIQIALLILYAYIAVGSVILHWQIGWGYIAAFYYLQLTFTTTGIGDLDPGDVVTVFHFFYVFFGYILAAMVLESIRVYLTENFRSGLQKVSQYLHFPILNHNIIMIPHA